MPRKPTLTSITRTNPLGNFRELLRDVAGPEFQDNRRNSDRLPRSLVLVVQPLDNNLQPVGSPFKAVTRDVSETGLGFLNETPFPTKFVRIGATAQSAAQSVARVCYNKTYFGDEPVYLVGVEFLEP